MDDAAYLVNEKYRFTIDWVSDFFLLQICKISHVKTDCPSESRFWSMW
jgi:hypothetical protein